MLVRKTQISGVKFNSTLILLLIYKYIYKTAQSGGCEKCNPSVL